MLRATGLEADDISVRELQFCGVLDHQNPVTEAERRCRRGARHCVVTDTARASERHWTLTPARKPQFTGGGQREPSNPSEAVTNRDPHLSAAGYDSPVRGAGQFLERVRTFRRTTDPRLAFGRMSKPLATTHFLTEECAALAAGRPTILHPGREL